jgi:hypothetical protein
MIRELQILDRECSKANTCIIMRSDYTMYGNDLSRDSADFIRSVSRKAQQMKINNVTIVAVIRG